MRAETIRPLFPELSTDDEIAALLLEVSGVVADQLPEPDSALAPLDDIPPLTQPERPGEYLGFDAFARTIVADQTSRLRATLENTDLTHHDEPKLLEGVFGELIPAVHQVAARTLVAVMHVLRERGRLGGGSSEERYRYFCRLSATPAFREGVVATFPELGRQVQSVVDGRVRHIERLLARAQDAVRTGALRSLVGDPDRLVSISASAGDRHAGGQSVVVLGFDNGSRVVYKPRAMQVEQAFGVLVSRFNEAAGAELPVLRVVCGDGWGWQEHADLAEPSDRASYYRAAGRMLLVLHVLRASDMHFENVLNHRGLPVVVDAETLFSINMRAGGADALQVAETALADSVHSVGFLPTRIFAGPESDESVDAGFLGYEAGQTAITDSVGFVGVGTDRMTVQLVRGVVAADAIRPASVPERPDTADVAALCGGFGELYDWVVEHRAEVRAWVEELFSGVGFRVVADNTRKYVQLLSLATHPSFQQSRSLTDVLFHRCGIGRADHVTPLLVRAEIDDLLRFDVPFFTLRTDSTSVYRWDGTPVAEVLDEPPLQHVVRGIDDMSPRLRELNLRVVRASYVDRSDAGAERALLVPGRTVARSGRPRGGHRRAAEDLVRRIATEVAGVALRGRGSEPTAWIGATITNTARRHPWRVEALNHGLYAGRSGIALFLTAAGRLLDDPGYAQVAEGYALRACDTLLADPGERAAQLDGGVAGGYAGLAYALVAGGLLGGHDEWVERGAALWEHLAEDLATLAMTDLLTGSAGVLTVSASMRTAGVRGPGGSDALDAVAHAAFRHLVEYAPELGEHAPDRAYSGFAHGTSGLYHALAAYGRAHAEAEPYIARLAAFHQERFGDGTRSGISSGDGDLQTYGWCHGTPGILLARCESDGAAQAGTGGGDVVRRLVGKVQETGVGLNFTLCHGDLGNLTILQRAARRYGDSETSAWVQGRLGHLLGHAVPTALAERGAKTMRNDGLFVGLTGVGYALIDLVAPGLVPAVLTLDVT